MINKCSAAHINITFKFNIVIQKMMPKDYVACEHVKLLLKRKIIEKLCTELIQLMHQNLFLNNQNKNQLKIRIRYLC